MDDLEKTDVILGPDDEGAAIGTESEEAKAETEDISDVPATDETAEAKADNETSEIDFESALLAPEPEEAVETQEAAPESTISDSLKTLKEVAQQLDNLPESQDANFNRLRKLNRELVKDEITKFETVERLASYGSPERIEEALTLLDGLDGYDSELGQPSTREFADKFAQKDDGKAYNLALNLMMQNTKNGKPFAEEFTRRVLGLDPARPKDFQAISKGEVPEGYEGMIDATSDLNKVPADFHDAYKRLTPKTREIVTEGLDEYSTQGEKAEAMRILQDSQKVITDTAKEQTEVQQKEATFQQDLVAKATEIEASTTESIGTKISKGLEKVVFSSDQTVDLTMKQAVETRLFDLVHESPYIRGRAEAYLKAVGVDFDRAKLDYHFTRLGSNIDIETVATLKGQKDAAARARSVILDAESHIAAMGLKIIAKVAQKAGGKLASQADAKVKLPKNQLPEGGQQDSAASGGQRAMTWQDAAAATRAGKAIGAGTP